MICMMWLNLPGGMRYSLHDLRRTRFPGMDLPYKADLAQLLTRAGEELDGLMHSRLIR